MRSILQNGILAVQITAELFLKAKKSGEMQKMEFVLADRARRRGATLEITVV